MSEWLAHLSNSFVDQTATWFVGVVLALLGAFSGRLVETVKFALNRADLRTRYYEELATEISRFVFVVDRIIRVSGTDWINPEGQAAIAAEYDETLNGLSRREYVYLSWLDRYWGRAKSAAFIETMATIREIDGLLILLNSAQKDKALHDRLESAHMNLRRIVHRLLVSRK